MAKRTIDVCGALIEKDGKFLVAQRKYADRFGGLWEFPGGKIEDGESKEAAMRRELDEELGIDVEVGRLAIITEDEIPEMKIIFHLFNCAIKKGEPRAIDCQDVKWVTAEELRGLKLAPVDIKIKDWLLERR
jgi:8-oxo-dGTP diphosphatase